jgi:hypothetical protein
MPTVTLATRSSLPWRLASSGTCPITAVPHHSATAEWDARMAALGVHVDRSDHNLFAHAARRRLIAAHPRVFIYYMNRFEIMTGNGHHPVRGERVIDRLLNWLRACHDERARQVAYVSTASPELFRDRPCLENCHCELEAKLRQLQAESGIQHFTILRPVSIMTVLVPSDYHQFGQPRPLRVLVHCDPRVQRQFIAAEDVGRIAARVLLQGEPFYERTLELSADRLSATQEATLRSEVAQRAVQCDTEDWTSYTSWLPCGVFCAEIASRWMVPQDAQRVRRSPLLLRALCCLSCKTIAHGSYKNGRLRMRCTVRAGGTCSAKLHHARASLRAVVVHIPEPSREPTTRWSEQASLPRST